MDTGEVTVISKERKFDVEWKIYNFTSLSEISYSSPEFCLEGEFWMLKTSTYYWNGGYIVFHLKRTSDAPRVNVQFSFAFKNVNGEKDLEKHTEGVFQGMCFHRILIFISRSDFMRRESEFLASGFLTVVCTIKKLNSTGNTGHTANAGCSYGKRSLDINDVSSHKKKYLKSIKCPKCSAEIDLESENEDKCIQTASYLNTNVSRGSLPEDFSKLLETGSDEDVEMKCGEDSIKTHKFVLSARSNVFRAMLQSDMLEGHTGVMEIQDMDVKYFQEFIKYLYTDVMPELTLDKAKALYKVGDKYDVKSLMLRCSEYLQDTLSPENAFECYALADAHSDEYLKENIKTYLLNKKVYLQSEHWLPFYKSFPEVALEVYKLSYENNHEV